MKIKLFSYDDLHTPIHRLSGITKLICFLFLTFATMFSYDIRVIILVMVFSLIIFHISKVDVRQMKLMIIYVAIFLLMNFVISYLFAPDQGSAIYGTRHVIAHLFGRYYITEEQILYQVTKLLKYASVVPFGMLFLVTTNPSEFASSLNSIGVNYKVCYALELTLRYFPDLTRDFTSISQAQQARGLDMSKKAKLSHRFKNTMLIIVPLIFSTLDRIELISNAMDLRGFGKNKKRTWYSKKNLAKRDFIAIFVSAFIFVITIMVSIFINHSRFYNPFK
ncbi:MAG: energy-coupling factor transporter transmembrane protein EcfT [Oscillospiraceae bacterium]|nr:energy-coupling factor transporter transmembrane protein EcfT [Oscillospiraceae bacterium]